MADSNLNDKITQLHTELNQTEPTEKTQATVSSLKETVKPIVDNPDADNTIHYHSLGERLNLALVDLDVDHPRLSIAIQSVLDELAAVGI